MKPLITYVSDDNLQQQESFPILASIIYELTEWPVRWYKVYTTYEPTY